MKKIMIAAMMLIGASTAFAGDSDALKAILKANDYAQAESLLKSSLSQLASNAEKAKAYNKLVELALKTYNVQKATMAANQTFEQLKQKDKVQPYDTVAFYNSAYNALKAAVECDKYDAMPNEKGKVKLNFRDGNKQRIWDARTMLVNGGQRAAQLRQNEDVIKYWGAFLDTEDSPLFTGISRESEKSYFGQVALFTSEYADMLKKTDLANKYIDMALKDDSVKAEATDMKIRYMQEGLTSRQDSISCLEKLKDFYATNSNNEVVFNSLASFYSGLGMKDDMAKLVSDKLAQDPNYFAEWRAKGLAELNANKYDDAITSFKKAIGVRSNDALALTYLGFSLNAKAATLNTVAEQKQAYTESLGYLQKAKEADPDRRAANWTYPLYQCYYALYGANDSRTKELESELKH